MKRDFENQLMMRYGTEADVKLSYNWTSFQFEGHFSMLGSPETGKSFIEQYEDGTFYDTYLEDSWSHAFTQELEQTWKKERIAPGSIEVSSERWLDSQLFGANVDRMEVIPYEEAVKKGYKDKIHVSIQSGKWKNTPAQRKAVLAYAKLAEDVDSVTVLFNRDKEYFFDKNNKEEYPIPVNESELDAIIKRQI